MTQYMFRTCPNCGFRVPNPDPVPYEYTGHLKPHLERILELLRKGLTPYQVTVELKLDYQDKDMIAYLRRKYGIVREKSAGASPRNLQIAARYHKNDITYRALGETYGITATRVRDIVLRVEQELSKKHESERVRQTAERIEDIPLDLIGLSVRALNGMINAGCTTVGDAMKVPDEVLLKTANFGRVSLNEWHLVLAALQKEFSEREGAKP